MGHHLWYKKRGLQLRRDSTRVVAVMEKYLCVSFSRTDKNTRYLFFVNIPLTVNDIQGARSLICRGVHVDCEVCKYFFIWLVFYSVLNNNQLIQRRPQLWCKETLDYLRVAARPSHVHNVVWDIQELWIFKVTSLMASFINLENDTPLALVTFREGDEPFIPGLRKCVWNALRCMGSHGRGRITTGCQIQFVSRGFISPVIGKIRQSGTPHRTGNRGKNRG